MSLVKLKTAPIILIEDDANKNIIPLLMELVPSEKTVILFCYEQPSYSWKSVFRNPNLQCYEEYNLDLFDKYTNVKSTIVIDSINEMALCMGWHSCLKSLKSLSSHSNVEQMIIVLHKDCLTHASKLQVHLNHMANAIVSYDTANPRKVVFRIKKGSKVTTSEEILSYDSSTATLKSAPIVIEEKQEEPEKPSPANLTTFKIEIDQIEKMERSKLKLPYMSKIHEGESKIIYEPDAVDDWDEEDPDEDLDF